MKTLNAKVSLGQSQYDLLAKLSKEYKLPMSNLIGFALDIELNKELPFKSIIPTIPDDDFVEFAYAEQAAVIMNYMTSLSKGLSLELLYLRRHDIGIPDAINFLNGFKECLNHGLLKTFTPRDPINYKYPPGTLHYEVNGRRTARSIKMEKKTFSHYLKLKAKFEKQGEM